MTDTLNDPLSRAILEYLYELTRTQRGTHRHETIGGGIAAHVGRRTGAPTKDIAVVLEQLVGAGLVRERQQLRLLSSGRSIDSWVYGITGSGIVELKGESRIGAAKDRPVEVLRTATDLRESYFNNLEARLLDFVRRGFRISGRTFDGCVISGPSPKITARWIALSSSRTLPRQRHAISRCIASCVTPATRLPSDSACRASRWTASAARWRATRS